MEDTKRQDAELDQFRTSISRYALRSSTRLLKHTTYMTSVTVAQPHKPTSLKRCQIESSNIASKSKKRKKIELKKDPNAYSHLKALDDYIAPDLDILFCGINPGCRSAESGHHFAHHSNHFWKCLHESGLTPSRIPPDDDYTLPEKFNYGLTNLAKRPSRVASELSSDELSGGVIPLLTQVSQYRPRIICIIGMGIWDIIERQLRSMCGKDAQGATSSAGNKTLNSKPGLKPYKMIHSQPSDDKDTDWVKETLFFNVPSTSARVTAFQYTDKVVCFTELRDLLEKVKASELSTSTMSIIPNPVHGNPSSSQVTSPTVD